MQLAGLLAAALLATAALTDGCPFPSRWQGLWFQKGVQDHIRLTNTSLSHKGVCIHADGDKFVLENRIERCYRCVVIHEKHVNVLQYKETFCQPQIPNESLESICSEINGDALLYSMFRLNTEPVVCPFRGPFTFTYNRGHGECSYPVSTVETCTDDTRILFRFQACVDVLGSESRMEELVCLATWKEGSARYLVGKLDHKMAKTDEDRFRCFVFEKRKREASGYLLSQSGDATCDGLFSASEGSRVLKLTRANRPAGKCHFPGWLTAPRHWRGLSHRLAYRFYGNNASYTVVDVASGALHARVSCVAELPSASRDLQWRQFVMHVTEGCSNGYRCVRLYRRSSHVVELQSGHLASQASEACQPFNFDPLTSDYTPLVTLSPADGRCPLSGVLRSEVPSAVLPCGPSTLATGCPARDKMELLGEACLDPRRLQCHTSWEENGTHYVIATDLGAAVESRYCITFAENGRLVHVSGSTEGCVRDVEGTLENFLPFNITNRGLCADSSPHSAQLCSPLLILILFLLSAILR